MQQSYLLLHIQYHYDHEIQRRNLQPILRSSPIYTPNKSYKYEQYYTLYGAHTCLGFATPTVSAMPTLFTPILLISL
jgi:hypothetical protein